MPDNKKIKKIIFLSLLTSFVPGTFLFFASYLGFFDEIFIHQVKQPKIKMIVLPHQGNYQKVGKKIIQVQQYLSQRKTVCQPAAIYYDDEEKVIKKSLRSAGGCVVKEIPNSLPKEYQIIRYEERNSVEARVSSHPGIAKLKLFSALKKYARETSTPMVFPIISLFKEKSCFFYFYL